MKSLLTISMASFALAACANHELTAAQHEQMAQREEVAAQAERRQYDPKAKTEMSERGVSATQGPFDATPDLAQAPLVTYNPTQIHLDAAAEHEHAADSHLKAAADLVRFENVACAGVSKAERAGCPLLTPSVEHVEETATGVKLHLKPDADAQQLGRIMGCHLAFAKVQGYDARTCPLYMVGVSLSVLDDNVIELKGASPGTARDLRRQARTMFQGTRAVSSAQ